MMPSRNSSTIGTLIGILVFAVAVIGTVFFNWTWANPEGDLLPLAIGVGAAVVAVILVLQNR